jgi:malonyl-CoA/methylmalonyl-CoA synthetase
VERNHLELLSDVLNLRNDIYQNLDRSTRTKLDDREEVYVAVLAAGGYEYACAVLAVLALGAAVVPMSVVLPVQEAAYFINKSQAAAILLSSSATDLGHSLARTICTSTNPDFRCFAISSSLFAPTLAPLDFILSSDKYLDDNAPGVVIFTSGTTGPPKGSVMRRAFTYDAATAVAELYGLTSSDSILHCLPVHHATGIGIMFFPFLISGCMIEFRSGGFDEHWLWERWREGATDSAKRITFYSGVPTMFMRMRRHYQRVLKVLPPEQLAQYVAGARQFRACLCGTSALPRPINDFWTELMGKRILQRYGATEFGAVFHVGMDDEKVPDGSVGKQVPGTELKLSEVDEGEVLVKSPWMFSKYLGDPHATARAHDDKGFYRTGDIARREGKYYWIVGRASLDIIKSGGYKISALDVEREILVLPYINEVMVVGVADEEFGQRIAALVSLQKEELSDEWRKIHSKGNHDLTLEALRQDLRRSLAGYKMPTLLRVMDGEIPKTSTGKLMKKTLGPKFFPAGYSANEETQVWRFARKADLKPRL